MDLVAVASMGIVLGKNTFHLVAPESFHSIKQSESQAQED